LLNAEQHKPIDIYPNEITGRISEIISDNTTYNSFQERQNAVNLFLKEKGVVGGHGTEIDPYIIKGWNIKCEWGKGGAGIGIDIQSDNEYFIIDDCFIYDCLTGIVFDSKVGGKITNCTITNIIYDGIENSGFLDSIENGIITTTEIGISNIYNGNIRVIFNMQMKNCRSGCIDNVDSTIHSINSCYLTDSYTGISNFGVIGVITDSTISGMELWGISNNGEITSIIKTAIKCNPNEPFCKNIINDGNIINIEN
jgi:hypothetical protein